MGSPEFTPELKRIGWAGLMSLPRVMQVAGDGSVLMEPASELETLRGRHMAVSAFPLQAEIKESRVGNASSQILLDGVQGDGLEILARFQPKTARRFGILVRAAPDFTEATRIEVDVERKKLIFDNTHSSLETQVHRRVREVDFTPARQGMVSLRIFVDRSVIEVFADQNRACITGRAYPQRQDSLQVGVCCTGGSVLCEGIDVWKRRPIKCDD